MLKFLHVTHRFFIPNTFSIHYALLLKFLLSFYYKIFLG